MEYRDAFYSLFHITETGFKVIVILALDIMVVGLIAGFTVYRKNLTGNRLMLLGAVLMALSVVIGENSTFVFRMPAFNLYLLLLGLLLVFIGFCWRDRRAESNEQGEEKD